MVDMPFDPYAGNILTQGLGPILDPAEMLRRLTYLPPKPGNVKGLPKLHRLHLLLVLRDFHWPFLEGRRLTETIDLMIRPGYRYRDPARAQTWSLVGGEPTGPKPQRSPASAAVAVTPARAASRKRSAALGAKAVKTCGSFCNSMACPPRSRMSLI